MADYRKDFLSMTDALKQNVHAVHIRNWDEYVSSRGCYTSGLCLHLLLLIRLHSFIPIHHW